VAKNDQWVKELFFANVMSLQDVDELEKHFVRWELEALVDGLVKLLDEHICHEL